MLRRQVFLSANRHKLSRGHKIHFTTIVLYTHNLNLMWEHPQHVVLTAVSLAEWAAHTHWWVDRRDKEHITDLFSFSLSSLATKLPGWFQDMSIASEYSNILLCSELASTLLIPQHTCLGKVRVVLAERLNECMNDANRKNPTPFPAHTDYYIGIYKGRMRGAHLTQSSDHAFTCF